MTATDIKCGVFPDMTDAEYFALPALSHSDLKLMQRTSPAKFRWMKDNDAREFKSEFDFGHVVHELVLGTGGGIEVIEADDWRTKAAKEQRDAARAAGRAPILVADYEQAAACAAGVRMHPVAAKLLDAADHTEIALVWERDGIKFKSKLDLVAGRIGVDVKTTDYADTEAFGRSAGKFGYATQDAFYREAMRACLGIDDPKFLFLVVERDPPYLVNVIELDEYDVELGARRNAALIERYRKCVETGEWPAYGTGINVAQLPRWAEIEMEME